MHICARYELRWSASWLAIGGSIGEGDTSEALVVREGSFTVVETSSARCERLRLLVCRFGAGTLIVPSLGS